MEISFEDVGLSENISSGELRQYINEYIQDLPNDLEELLKIEDDHWKEVDWAKEGF